MAKSQSIARKTAELMLEDGAVFQGIAFGHVQPSAGEVVFSTGMVGYQESLTDPSYTGQILAMTYPLVGNYGVTKAESYAVYPKRMYESDTIHIRGLIVSSAIDHPSHYLSTQSLDRWLQKEKIPGVYGIDTRALTQHLRERGTMLGRIQVGSQSVDWYDPDKENLVAHASCTRPRRFGKGKHRIVVIDCGVKHGILRAFVDRSCRVMQVPWDFPADRIFHEADGVIISNGPGNPALVDRTVVELRRLISRRMPLWGICMGHQLLARALGAKTYKLPYGHRGHNQPVINELTGKSSITSQNHGFAVQEKSLPRNVSVWFRNLNDGTVEGFKHLSRPLWGVQFHPEASPGPLDTNGLFDQFLRSIR
ncbi:MAG: carbamoyl phosphate synthase small subunit [Candidatus Kerfeldbacteria bacterium RIFCSPLOWO2_01_FULL_48_11]|uniref:Carbamoyl phosphate synthase small chain n=1 Tax=Candidatus Kerfeldbacteria bacterium RIFCSPLOWO2_01_FULL_48_11 TaxID=1798543 RepID=A0A1G2B2C9_9BACT|nr:MAG: Carbamoyl-phosphate synthase small chain [Parcubacteria group bacterium GW2011_GWC2_49_9]OGY82896.1 MAG: carbamoyl phosphate synthase small subunit [Candidatus Kerfeldbacteria bacterium RIFCSPLOWO2_01_FULL_48_11]HCJ52791.1 carbamoyl-phosphate synthase (glutamine-hydrolyzing) small subunit [Candidatus Kerfeldbacteria bacterium]